jgi:hypothetical protein
MSDWDWWFEALDRKKAGQKLDMNPDNPHAGFYRQPRKAFYGARRTFLPVAYWPGENGKLNCRLGDEDIPPERGQALWQSVGNHPVTEEAYRKVAQEGGQWPDEHELVAMGDNLPPEEMTFEGMRDAIEPRATEARKRLEGPPIKDQDEGDRLANLADALAQLWKQADDLRRAEKRPHDEAAAAVQKKWAPILLAAETYKNLKYKLLTPWLKAMEEKAKQETEEAIRMGAVEVVETRRPRVGTRGRAVTLKALKHAKIINYDEALQFFKESPDVRQLVQDLANRAVRAGIAVPGTETIEESSAV